MKIMKKKQTTFVWLMCSRISLRASIFFVRVYFVRLCQTLLQFHLGGIDNTWNKHKTIVVWKSKPCQELIQADIEFWDITYINDWIINIKSFYTNKTFIQNLIWDWWFIKPEHTKHIFNLEWWVFLFAAF